MGVTFIGNPFDQDAEYDDSDWDINGVEEWTLPAPQILFPENGTRTGIDLIPTPEIESSESDDDYMPDDEDDENEVSADSFDNDVLDFEPYFYDSNEDEEEIDYVTYPVRQENDPEPEKPSTTNTSNPDENSDTDTD